MSSPPPPGGDDPGRSLLPDFDQEHALELYREDPSKALAYVVDQVEQRQALVLPPSIREWIVHRLPRAVLEAAQRPVPYPTGLGFIGEIVFCLLDQADRELLPPDAPEPARATLRSITATLRRAVEWTTGRTPADIAAATEGLSPHMREAGGELVADPTPAEALDRLRALGLPSIEELYQLAIALGWATPVPPAKRRRRPILPPLQPWVPFTADRVEQGMHEAICRAGEWGHDLAFRDLAGRELAFARGLERRTEGFRWIIGYQREAADLVQALADSDTLALKLVHVLWGRWFDQAGGDVDQWARLDLGQLCSDLGITRHHSGGYRREHKAQVAGVYEAITSLELYAEYRMPRDRKLYTLRGSLWDRGVQTAILGENGSLDVSAQVYWRPGHLFSDPRWRPANSFLGHISRGLLQMDPRRSWAIRLGDYYAMLARRRRDSSEFRERHEVVERVRVILQATALDAGYGNEPKKQQRAFEEAHDQLVESGLLVAHRYGDRAAGDWRNSDKVLVFPAELGQLNAQLRLRLPIQAGG